MALSNGVGAILGTAAESNNEIAVNKPLNVNESPENSAKDIKTTSSKDASSEQTYDDKESKVISGHDAQKAEAQDPDQAENGEDEDEDEDDEDYVVEDNTSKVSGATARVDSESDEDDYIDEEDRKSIAKYNAIESSAGGLIKTRTQRLLEEEREKMNKKKMTSSSKANSNLDINSIWAELNNTTSKKNETSSETNATPNLSESSSSPPHPDTAPKTIFLQSSSVSANKKIKITRTYEFAGKMVTEEKWVDADSQEAKAHMNSTTIAHKEQQQHQQSTLKNHTSSTSLNPALRKKRKRASLLDAVISNSSKTKLSTLEKSRLDWATYVDKNKINDELKYSNKNGFLEKQDFLNRVESRRDNLFKEAKTKK